ncbi:MAG: hypothetical protein ACKN9V_01000 [Pseudomonadota bacterium]
MKPKYVKTSDGRGVLLNDLNIINAAKEKEELYTAIQTLKTQIDMLQQRISNLEQTQKD